MRAENNKVILGTDAFVYELATALFSDYALKLRTIHLPAGSTAQYHPEESFTFPVGTIVSKTFFYPKNPTPNTAAGTRNVSLSSNWDGNPDSIDLDRYELIETRLLVKQSEGWDALPYIWNGTDARLSITGDLFTLNTADETLNYLVPSRNQCASCHATNHTSGEILPIGLKARHLNRPTQTYQEQSGSSQLSYMAEAGLLSNLPMFDIPKNASLHAINGDAEASIEDKARAYLDINCGHCHNPHGAADTSGLLLDIHSQDIAALGVCKPPIAAGRGSGGHLYSIVPGMPDASIMTFRMASTNPASMMPELGRSLAHDEGIAVVSQWIAEMRGECR